MAPVTPFTGPSWGWGADGTRAMADGIAVLTAAGAILVVAMAVGGGPRRLVPAACIAAGLVSAALGALLGTSADPLWSPARLAALACIALGLCALSGLARWGTPARRWLVGGAAALAIAPIALLLLPALALAVPLLAGGWAIWGIRAPRAQRRPAAVATA
ncbi:MAG: hypothetical protein R2732_04880 [Microbacteriaceae bacterium]|nr:hypothetical protein [Microbacteriaceae bacterium]HQC94052.1 hypothetical protein [Microbacteriaceae bacterium]